MKYTRTIAGLICVAFLFGGYTWWNLTRVSIGNDSDAYLIKKMVPIYKSLPFDKADDYASVRAALEKAQVIDLLPIDGSEDTFHLALTKRLKDNQDPIFETRITQSRIDSLLDQLAELIYYRMINRDPSEYISIRKSRGAVAPTAEELIAKGWGELSPMFEYYIGRPATSEDTMENLVIETFDRWRDETSIGELRAIAAGGDGIVVSVGLIDQSYDSNITLYSSSNMLGLGGWGGSAPATGGTFLFPKEPLDDLLEQYGALPYARVGVVVDYTSADPQAIVFTFLYNPTIQDWQFSGSLFINRKNQDALTLPHF